MTDGGTTKPRSYILGACGGCHGKSLFLIRFKDHVHPHGDDIGFFEEAPKKILFPWKMYRVKSLL
jgi:hypothetical protein